MFKFNTDRAVLLAVFIVLFSSFLSLNYLQVNITRAELHEAESSAGSNGEVYIPRIDTDEMIKLNETINTGRTENNITIMDADDTNHDNELEMDNEPKKDTVDTQDVEKEISFAEIIDRVSMRDQLVFLSIAGKLRENERTEIFNLLKDGITETDIDNVRDLLKDILSEQDFRSLLNLYAKYKEILLS